MTSQSQIMELQMKGTSQAVKTIRREESADGSLQCCNAVVTEIWYNNRSFHMHILDEIRAKRGQINVIARRHKADKPWGFGSCGCKEVAA